MINDNSTNFDMIIGTDVIHQDILTISLNDIKINEFQNYSKNSLVNVIDTSEVTVNSKVNLYSSSFQSSNSNYSSTKIKI